MAEINRQQMDVDIVCVGFGPGTGGFLTTLSRGLLREDGTPVAESRVMPGMPPQIICYERADDISFGVSGVVTRGQGIRESFPDLDLEQIPMAAPVSEEKVVYLLDPIGASRRPALVRLADRVIRAFKWMLPFKKDALELPYIPGFLRKHDGWVMALGQFNQWIGNQVMASGVAQIWPGTPVAAPLVKDGKVEGVRLADQGVDKDGNPDVGYMPGMDIHAALTVVGDGPVGAVGQALDKEFGLPEGCQREDWAVGMKMVVDLPEHCTLAPGTVLHTLGFPEPEIFGFLYVYPERKASLGIFVPSWFANPVRTAYRYLQHWMMHPYIWQHVEGGTLRSWGAKSLQEAGKNGEPYLVGDGYARIGEGSGSTNVLTNSGVDEAWTSGVLLGEAVLELLKEGKPFSRENLEAAYVARRRASRLEKEGEIARHARDGFHRGFVAGVLGTGLTGITRGLLRVPGKPKAQDALVPGVEEFFAGKIPPEEIAAIKEECTKKGTSLHDALMERAGWPSIPYDGKLLVSHQDVLLLGGKVQAPAGYADHVVFVDAATCEACDRKVCVEMCSAQAITLNPEGGVPLFDREKCVHCGACMWNCIKRRPAEPEKSNIDFRAGAGGLHSAEN